MNRKSKIESNKVSQQIDIIRNYSERGLYFNIKPTHRKSMLGISALRSSIMPHFYKQVIEQLYKNPLPTRLLGKYRKIQELSSEDLTYTDINNELLWAKHILQFHFESISNFVELSNEYSSNLLIGEYESCFNILNKIEESFGHSIWLIKNKIALLQLAQGLEEQKKYAQSIRKELKNGSLARFITYWVSIRNEEQTTANRFRSQIESITNRLNPESQLGYKEFIQYHLIGFTPQSTNDFVHVLRISYSISLIDYYEAYISMVYNMAIDDSYINRVLSTINHSPFIEIDYRLDYIYDIITNNIIQLRNRTSIIYDNILLSKYEEAENGMVNIEISKNEVPIYIILQSYIKAFRYNNEINQISCKKNLQSIIIENLSAVIRKGKNNSVKEYNELSKLHLNFNTFTWITSIDLLLCKENSFNENMDKEQILNTLKSNVIHPYYLWFIGNSGISEKYRDIINKTYNEEIAVNFHKSIDELSHSKELDNCKSEFAYYIKSLIEFKNEDYEKAINYAEKIKNSDLDFFVRRGYGILSYSYFHTGEYDLLCNIISENVVSEKNHTSFLPLREFSEAVEPGSDSWENISGLIDFPITIDCIYKNANQSIEMNRRFAFEDFLSRSNVQKPSMLHQLINKIDKDKLIYYLRFICLESIMETSGFFEGGSKEVLDERLAICRLLLELDPKNEKIYKLEIKELLRRQIISSRRQEIDKSRIYVDIQAIRDWANVELSESFNRYISYIEINLANMAMSTNNTLSTVGEELSIQKNINVPVDEASSLFRYIFEEIRKMYLSVEVGLDRFISTRIRHGELERTMRIPIQKHKLITKRITKDGPYKPNQYWIDKLEGITDCKHRTENVFSYFSKKYDDLIFNIANQYLQINKSNKPDGLFDFNFYDSDINQISQLIKADTSIEECVNQIINILETRLIYSLAKIREYLNNICKQKAKELLNELNDEVNSCMSNCTSIEFERALFSAKTDLSLQFDKIIEWFVPPASGSSTPFKIEDAIAVAEEIIKEDTPNFKINYPPSESTLQIHGQLPIFVDVFINIFDNVVKRSGIDLPQATVDIVEGDENNEIMYMKISIINKLSTDIDIDKLSENLKSKKKLLDSGNYIEYLAREGNSGLFKIHKSVMDFNVAGRFKATLNFGVVDNIFHIEMEVPFQVFNLESED